MLFTQLFHMNVVLFLHDNYNINIFPISQIFAEITGIIY